MAYTKRAALNDALKYVAARPDVPWSSTDVLSAATTFFNWVNSQLQEPGNFDMGYEDGYDGTPGIHPPTT